VERFTSGLSNLRPMSRFTMKMVFSGFVIAWRLAICPTSRSPDSVRAMIDGVVRLPSLLGMTTGSPPSITATQELVVPRSMPITLAMVPLLAFAFARAAPHEFFAEGTAPPAAGAASGGSAEGISGARETTTIAGRSSLSWSV
jgi:hypothetical protein